MIDDAKAKGLMINTWTINDSAQIERLKQMGIDGIISDYPQRL
ncbi:glycerophosphodiester phosphodiesterase [Acetohalobium arabaticum]|nr:glycerophosphodiester phosphodiesterase family protein [Acetohalobium arabaticum]